MAVDHDDLVRRIEKISYDEQGSILKDVAAVDAKLFDRGERNIPSWMSERARVIAAGVRRAGAKMADEVWAIAAEEAPEFAHEAATWAGRLSARMVAHHRQRLMFGRGLATSCGNHRGM